MWTRSGLARLGAVYRTLRALHAVQCGAVQCEQADPRRNALRDDRRRVPPPKVPCAISSCNQLTVNPTTRERVPLLVSESGIPLFVSESVNPTTRE